VLLSRQSYPVKKERLPVRRKAVTFILGNKSSDGVVLFADRLESGSVVKKHRQKLHAVNKSGWGVAWGVSNDALIADNFSDKIRRMLEQEKSYNREKLELLIQRCLRWVHDNFPQKDAIEIIVGFGSMAEVLLFRGDSLSAAIAPVEDFVPSGMDTTLAAFLMNSMRNPFLRVDEAIRLGVCVTLVMKEYAEGVGGPTDVFVWRLGDKAWDPLLAREITAIEADFPVTALENHAQAFWMNHPKARNNDELLRSESALRKVRSSKVR
jgi:hypothetical protein